MDVTYEGTKRELATDEGTLRYHEAGTAGEGEPLILLHGSGPGVTGWRNYRGNLGSSPSISTPTFWNFPASV